MQTGNTNFIFKNKLDKACFQHDMAYGKSKDLVKHLKLQVIQNLMVIKEDQHQWFPNFLIKNLHDLINLVEVESLMNQTIKWQMNFINQLLENFKKRKVYSCFRDNNWGVDLADMQSLSKYNKGIKQLLCAIDIFSKYAWVVPLKDKKAISVINIFQKIISEGRKPNKIWVDQGSEFYNQSFKDFLKINNIEMYSTYNEGKSVVAERFIRTLKNKIFKHMKAISKNVYFDVLDDTVNKYNNTVHKTIKMKPINITDDSYAEYSEDFNKKDSKFKVGDHVRISKYKSIFAKGYAPNWSEIVSKNNK